jgi:penicillin-binding protein 1A
MGLIGGRKRGRRIERREPRLFHTRGGKLQPKPPHQRRSVFGFLFGLAFKGAIISCLLLALGFGFVWASLDKKGLLQIPQLEPGIMLLASDGTVLSEQGSFYGDQVRVAELPDYVVNALLAIEDRRFRSHYGIDPLGLIRAMTKNAVAGRMVEGGSTLTQQLAKNLFLTPERTLSRKAQEAVLAIWLERKYSKDEILQLYLNRVYYGSGAVGIEKAAQTFFRKPATELTLAEAATLAGTLKAPTTYNPINHPIESANRTSLVLQAMVRSGYISDDEAQQAISAPSSVAASDYVPATQYVVDWVGEQLPQLAKNYDQSIVVETTIDPHLQLVAEKALRKRLNEVGKKLRVGQGALVLLDATGAVRALVGGKSYKRSQYNRATKALRQPGSAFKPFVYLAAMEQGYKPTSVEVDEPIRIGDWSPENYRHKYLGPVTLTTALAQSLNTVAAKLANQVGPSNVVAAAHKLGITSKLGNDASIALGTSEVTLLEMTSAFTPFANGGYTVQPYAVKRITTKSGKVLYERHGEGFGQTISPRDLGAMNTMLRAVITQGTAKKAGLGDFEVAGKTGTSQDYRDAWFIGYSTYYVGGVWVGNDDNSPTKAVTGGSLPTTIWRDVMVEAHQNLSPQALPGEIDVQPEQPAPYMVSEETQAQSQQDFEQAQAAPPPRRKRNFFEKLFDIEVSDKPRKKKSLFGG